MDKKWIEIAPPWIQALGILGLIFFVVDRIEIDYKDSAKSKILRELSTSQSPISEKDLFKNIEDKEEKELSIVALYELMSNKVVLKTASGFEITRHNTRLFDDIDILVEFELDQFSQSDKNVVPLIDFTAAIKKGLIALEKERGNNKGEIYVDKIGYYITLVTLKNIGNSYHTTPLFIKDDNNDVNANIFSSPYYYTIEKIPNPSLSPTSCKSLIMPSEEKQYWGQSPLRSRDEKEYGVRSCFLLYLD